MSVRRVAVIGAGASGLVAAKWLRAEGLEPVVFEQSDRVGGVWTYDETRTGGGSPSYRSLVTNVSRQKTHLSDHPLADELGDFPARARVLEWLEAYADRFDLLRLVRLRTPVQRVAPLRGGGWSVDNERFDAVVVASGLFTRPFVPAVKGVDAFVGQIVHAAAYMHPEPFADLDVIVVGAGSSGADIAVELSQVARVALSVREVASVVPKTVAGRPLDHLLTRRMERRKPQERGRLLHEAIVGEYRRRGVADPATWPSGLLPLAHGRAPTPSEELAAKIVDGTIALRPAPEWFEADGVFFKDGSYRRADLVIFATGYELAFPYLPPGLVPIRGLAEIDLYRQVWHPTVPGLAFIGICRVSGAVPPIAEMQARWVAQVLAGRQVLPGPDEMRREIGDRRAHHAAAGTEYMRVPFLGYLDEIGELLGVRPRDERKLLDEVVSATQYR